MRSSTSAISILRSTIRSVSRTLSVIGRIDPPEHRALELAAEAVHMNLIPQLAAHHAAFAPPPDLFEAGLLLSPDPCRVPPLQRSPSDSGLFRPLVLRWR